MVYSGETEKLKYYLMKRIRRRVHRNHKIKFCFSFSQSASTKNKLILSSSQVSGLKNKETNLFSLSTSLPSLSLFTIIEFLYKYQYSNIINKKKTSQHYLETPKLRTTSVEELTQTLINVLFCFRSTMNMNMNCQLTVHILFIKFVLTSN